jgi:hypothetical protein
MADDPPWQAYRLLQPGYMESIIKRAWLGHARRGADSLNAPPHASTMYPTCLQGSVTRRLKEMNYCEERHPRILCHARDLQFVM